MTRGKVGSSHSYIAHNYNHCHSFQELKLSKWIYGAYCHIGIHFIHYWVLCIVLSLRIHWTGNKAIHTWYVHIYHLLVGTTILSVFKNWYVPLCMDFLLQHEPILTYSYMTSIKHLFMPQRIHAHVKGHVFEPKHYKIGGKIDQNIWCNLA